uniref:MIF4G domain-containing protein n=1 Tax=viral metagenome TaxID=1070528 RepID=A0A6C0IXK5_9ZZZZ
MTSIITYNIDFIENLSKNIDTILDEKTINCLLEIKKNNKFITQTNPLILGYNMNKETANNWRDEKENNSKNSLDKFKDEINSALNKLTNANIKKIEDIITNSIVSIINNIDKDIFRKEALEIIFNKSIEQHNYSKLYVSIISLLINKFGNVFSEELIVKIDNFYQENIIKNFKNSANYEEMCKNNKEKHNLLGTFIFIGELYKKNIIDKLLVIKYLDILSDYILNSKDELDKYVECYVNLIEIIGKKLESEDNEKFSNIILILNNINNDKQRFKSRLRFLVLDLIELHINNWEK